MWLLVAQGDHRVDAGGAAGGKVGGEGGYCRQGCEGDGDAVRGKGMNTEEHGVD